MKAQTSETYRILDVAEWSGEANYRRIGYSVSVAKWLKQNELKKLICEILRKENPRDYGRISVDVYHQLEEYIPPAGHPGLGQKLMQHLIGTYVWNVGLPGNPNALTLYKDATGKSFPDGLRRCRFDHMEDCKEH